MLHRRQVAVFASIICVMCLAQDVAAQNVLFKRKTSKDAPIVAGRLHDVGGRIELSAFIFDASILNTYVEHPYAAHFGLGYHVFDWLSFETYFGYVVSKKETAVVRRIREELKGDTAGELSLPKLWQTDWFAHAHVEWAPFYGKLSLASEYDLSFQLYGQLGGGINGIRKAQNDGTFISSKQRYTLNAGAGVRLFLTDWLAIRTEIRSLWGANPEEEGLSSTTWLNCGLGFFI